MSRQGLLIRGLWWLAGQSRQQEHIVRCLGGLQSAPGQDRNQQA